jgi:hypothetical protein
MKWGGLEVSFQEILKEGREVVEEIREETPRELPPPRPEDDASMHLARQILRWRLLMLIDSLDKSSANIVTSCPAGKALPHICDF